MIWWRSMLEVRTRGTTSYDAATVRIHGYFSFLYLCLSAVSEGLVPQVRVRSWDANLGGRLAEDSTLTRTKRDTLIVVGNRPIIPKNNQ
jgi:hypothetical protein